MLSLCHLIYNVLAFDQKQKRKNCWAVTAVNDGPCSVWISILKHLQETYNKIFDMWVCGHIEQNVIRLWETFWLQVLVQIQYVQVAQGKKLWFTIVFCFCFLCVCVCAPEGMHVTTHQAAGSYSAHILTYSSRWWGPSMDESLVRYSKLSIMTATNRFSIYTCSREIQKGDTEIKISIRFKYVQSSINSCTRMEKRGDYLICF